VRNNGEKSLYFKLLKMLYIQEIDSCSGSNFLVMSRKESKDNFPGEQKGKNTTKRN
jgi:hypothetical protein